MATLKDIAGRTGMAVSSVSDILNERPGVNYSSSARDRVRAAAKELGYLPNRLARGLLRGKTAIVGFLVPDVSNAFYTTILKTAAPLLREAGYSLLIDEAPVGADGSVEARAMEQLAGFRIDGLLACLVYGEQHVEFLGNLARGGTAVVVSSLPPDADIDVDAVEIDFAPGVDRMAGDLVATGHRDFVFIGNHPTDRRLGRRRQLVAEAFARHGVEGQPATLIPCENDKRVARRVFLEFLQTCDPGKRPTALVALNDELAVGAMRAALDFGLSVPEDLSVVGFDNTPLSEVLPVALSSVGFELEDYGRMLAETMLARLRGPRPEKPVRKVLEASFHSRESSGPAPDRL